VPYRNDSVMEN